MSCGMAWGRQPYHLVGVTRRALVVAGPVSTEMALLAAARKPAKRSSTGELGPSPAAFVGQDVTRRRNEAACGRVPSSTDGFAWGLVRRTSAGHARRLLPTQFHSLVDVHHRAGELKQVAMGFVRLQAPTIFSTRTAVDGLHRRLRAVTEVVDTASAEVDVCWLETQAEENSVRWTLISAC